MILGKPNDIDKFVCVNSEVSIKIGKLGFVPLYREIGKDNIYYLKTKELEEVIKNGI